MRVRSAALPIVGLLLLVPALAGCVSESPEPARADAVPQGSQSASAANATNPDVGVIEGTVTDDELNPIENATVTILQLNVEVRTTPEGAYEFTEVPAGTQTVAAAKLGYDSVARRVEVAAGDEPTVANLILTPLAVDEAYFLAMQHNVLFHLASTYPTWILNMTGVSNSCEGCTWKINTTVPATAMQWEVYGKHTVTNPQGDAEYLWIFRDNYDLTGTTGERIYNNAAGKLPLVASFDDKVIKKTTQFFSQILCDYYWFCVEEKREMWFTAFYGMELPEGYTAKPPE